MGAGAQSSVQSKKHNARFSGYANFLKPTIRQGLGNQHMRGLVLPPPDTHPRTQRRAQSNKQSTVSAGNKAPLNTPAKTHPANREQQQGEKQQQQNVLVIASFHF